MIWDDFQASRPGRLVLYRVTVFWENEMSGKKNPHQHQHRRPSHGRQIIVDLGDGRTESLTLRGLESRRHILFDGRPDDIAARLSRLAAAVWMPARRHAVELPSGDFARHDELRLMCVRSADDLGRASLASVWPARSDGGRLILDHSRRQDRLFGRKDVSRFWEDRPAEYALALDLEAARSAIDVVDRRLSRVSDANRPRVEEQCRAVHRDLFCEAGVAAAAPPLWYGLPAGGQDDVGFDLRTLIDRVPPAAMMAAARVAAAKESIDTGHFTIDLAWLADAARQVGGDPEAWRVFITEALGEDLAAFDAFVVQRAIREHNGFAMIPAALIPPDLRPAAVVFAELKPVRGFLAYNHKQYLCNGLDQNQAVEDPARARVYVWDLGGPPRPECFRATTEYVDLDLWADVPSQRPPVARLTSARVVVVRPADARPLSSD
jgi:hypothetical protein